MKKLFSLLLILFALSSCQHDDEPAAPITVNRTVLAYVMGDSSTGLTEDLDKNVADMVIGYASVQDSNTHFLIYYDRGGYPLLYELVKNSIGTVDKIVIKTYPDQISTDKTVMAQVFSDAFTLRPAKQYGAIFSSHATGWLPATKKVKSKSFGWDSNYQMDITDMADALKSTNYHFDFMLFDACFMGCAEPAYEFRDISDYLIASTGEVMAAGFPYKEVTPYLFKSGEDNLKKIADLYYNYYDSQSRDSRSALVSIIKLDQMDALAAQVKLIIGKNIIKVNSFSPSGFQYFDSNGSPSDITGQHDFYDLKQFMDSISANTDIAFGTALNNAVIYKLQTPNLTSVVNGAEDVIPINVFCGLGTYIPQQGKTKNNSFYKTLSWYTAAGWDQTGW